MIPDVSIMCSQARLASHTSLRLSGERREREMVGITTERQHIDIPDDKDIHLSVSNLVFDSRDHPQPMGHDWIVRLKSRLICN